MNRLKIKLMTKDILKSIKFTLNKEDILSILAKKIFIDFIVKIILESIFKIKVVFS